MWTNFVQWLLGHTRRRRIAGLAVLVAVPAGAGLLVGMAQWVDPPSLLILAALLLLGGAYLLTWPRPRAAYDRAGWPSPHVAYDALDLALPCALCGHNCAPGGFYVELAGWPGFYRHSVACGPLPYQAQLAAPTHEYRDGMFRRLEAT